MSRRGENIYKRGDGRWEGRYIRGRTPEGRAQYGYVYAATYSACREKRRQRLQELPREITPSNNMTLPEAVELFFTEREQKRKLKESTVSRYRYMVRRYIQPQLGAAPLYTLTESGWRRFIKGSKDRDCLPKAPEMRVYCCGPFCGRQPSGGASVRHKRRASGVQKAAGGDIHRAGDRAAGAHIVDEPDLTGLGILLALNSGLRLGELCALRWSDIDLHAGFLRVEREVQRLYEKGCTKLIVQPPKSESSLRQNTAASRYSVPAGGAQAEDRGRCLPADRHRRAVRAAHYAEPI